MKMTKNSPDYIVSCPACQEAVKLGLSFEETHSSRKQGFLQIDNPETGEEKFIKNPHIYNSR